MPGPDLVFSDATVGCAVPETASTIGLEDSDDAAVGSGTGSVVAGAGDADGSGAVSPAVVSGVRSARQSVKDRTPSRRERRRSEGRVFVLQLYRPPAPPHKRAGRAGGPRPVSRTGASRVIGRSLRPSG